jgi:hypothetical protein
VAVGVVALLAEAALSLAVFSGALPPAFAPLLMIPLALIGVLIWPV